MHLPFKTKNLFFNILHILVLVVTSIALKCSFMYYCSLSAFIIGIIIYFILLYYKNSSILINIFGCILTGILIFYSIELTNHFVIGTYKINGASMENCFFSGDRILVLKYGFKGNLPNHLADKTTGKKLAMEENCFKPPIKKRTLHKKIRHQDIILYRELMGENTMIKRCIALPADTLQVKASGTIINGKPVSQLPSVKFRYRIYFNNFKKVMKSLKELELKTRNYYEFHYQHEKTGNYIVAFAAIPSAKKLESLKYIDSIKVDSYFSGHTTEVSPEKEEYSWAKDDFGPIVIPAEGMEILLNDSTFALYGKTIRRFEGVGLTKNKYGFLINGKQCSSYRFSKDYYWFMGDNRYYSEDSRNYGFIPETLLIGRAIYFFPSH